MFQTYEPVSDRSFAGLHLPKLRKVMTDQSLDGFLVPHDDEYQNEYIPAYAERLMWVSGFTGSAGFAIILHDSAAIFTDGRYTLQVRDQADDAFFSYHDLTAKQPSKWLMQNAKVDMRIGYDPMLHTITSIKNFESAAQKAGFELVAVSKNPVDIAWEGQPDKPCAQIVPHEIAHAGLESHKKRENIASKLRADNIDAALITTPPSVAWVFNIRGGDVARSPLPLSRAIIYQDGKADLFIDIKKHDDCLAAHLGNDVGVFDEADIIDNLARLAKDKVRILIDPHTTPVRYGQELSDHGATLVHGEDPCLLPKACKNKTEIAGTRTAHIRDGVAVTKFLHWLAGDEVQSGAVDEIAASSKLEAFRAEDKALKDLSFDSISGAGPNGAIVHYRVSTETNRKLEKNSLFLIDSGGQYPDGTTDITRTVAIGMPTDEMKNRFTLVLKGHIALATAKFPKGTSGHQLDVLARLPLWQAGLDYDHGTGHGVGSFLGVHEGPQRIAKWPNAVALQPGMILSNEPGYYKTGEYGIRIENLIVVSSFEAMKEGEREMMSFETITLAPIDRNLIEKSLLSTGELEWLNAYHQRVRETLSPLLKGKTLDWLSSVTEAI